MSLLLSFDDFKMVILTDMRLYLTLVVLPWYSNKQDNLKEIQHWKYKCTKSWVNRKYEQIQN